MCCNETPTGQILPVLDIYSDVDACDSLKYFFQLCTYTTFEYPVRIFSYVDKQRKRYNFTEL